MNDITPTREERIERLQGMGCKRKRTLRLPTVAPGSTDRFTVAAVALLTVTELM